MMTVNVDKASRLRSLLKPNELSEVALDVVLEYPDDSDESRQADLRRKVISLGSNVLRIVDSGNGVNKTGISNKVDLYFDQVESELNGDVAQQGYFDLLHAINEAL